jgi:lysophospholipase L1-like esterase/photosystem II stability/assembly factor-like uncharacterized protein
MRPLVLCSVVALLPSACVAAGTAPKKPAANPAAVKAPVPNALPAAWRPMPLLSPEAKKAGVSPGGEGCQWPRGGVVISEADPSFMLLPIDVGGLYRSLDGGKNWQIAVVGWDARGANALAIDPRNPRHVIGVAANGADWNDDWGASPHGIYVSNDKAASWKHVLALNDGKQADAAAFDPTSFDAAKGVCTVAYVSSNRYGLLKTNDGGETWAAVSTQPVGLSHDENSPPRMAVHPKTGAVYLGGKGGLFVSTDGGKTFAKKHDANVWGLSVHADRLWISGAAGLLTSADGGGTWETLPAAGVNREANNKPVRDVSVSPADPRRMTVWVQGGDWKWVRYVSQDGGKSFAPVKIEQGVAGNMPLNVRQGWYAWHPKDPNVCYGLGGDWVTKSTDGGKTFTWENNGYNGVMLGGMFNFSPQSPDTVFLSFQDYNAAFTTDGGATWNYRDASGKGYGGYCYGGYTPDGRIMFYGDSDHWGPPRRLRVSRDGGKTWAFVNGPDGKPLTLDGADVSLSDPADPKFLFCGSLRSADGGATWARMADCEGVFTFNPATKALYGKKGSAVVVSKDHGATWTKAAEVEGGFRDVAVDHKSGRVYVASQDQLKVWDGKAWTTVETPKDQYGRPCVRTVAVDPQATAVVYVGGSRDIYSSHATVCRTTDAGKTWTNLTVNAPLAAGAPGGPHEVSAIRVHPVTREAWAAGQCYGMWRIAPPTKDEKGVAAALAAAPPALTPPAAQLASAPAKPGDGGAAVTHTVYAFNPGSFVYAYGQDWKIGKNVTTAEDGGVKGVKIDATENGGAGIVLNGADIAPGGETQLVMRVRALPGNEAGALSVNVQRQGGGQKSYTFALPKPGADGAAMVTVPLGDGDFHKVQGIQVQGTNFGPGARPLKVILASLGTTKQGATAADVAAAKASDPTAGPPVKDKPSVPGWGYYPDYPQAWMSMYRAQAERTKLGGIDVVFLGDSITQGWGGEGKATWEQTFAPLKAVNYGIGGDSTRQVLWRIDHGILDGISPKLVVLLIGTNNLYGDFNAGTDDEIADGVKAVVARVREKQPKAKVLLLGLLPRQNEFFCGRIKTINARIAKLDDGKTVRYLDMGPSFQESFGKVKPDLYVKDQLHLAAPGYAVWAKTMQPLLSGMLAR